MQTAQAVQVLMEVNQRFLNDFEMVLWCCSAVWKHEGSFGDTVVKASVSQTSLYPQSPQLKHIPDFAPVHNGTSRSDQSYFKITVLSKFYTWETEK